MGSGSAIHVAPDVTLRLWDETLLYGCPQMWQGITLLGTNSEIFVDHSTIRDADIAINAEDKTKFFVSDSKILDCVTGIYTEPIGGLSATYGTVTGTKFSMENIAFKGYYPTQPQHGIWGRAGMNLNNVTLTVGDNSIAPNEFSYLNFGIEAHNSNVTVTNSRFHDIIADAAYGNLGVLPPFGCAITARTSNNLPYYNLIVLPLASAAITTITNAPVGVYNNYVNTRVLNVSMSNVGRGVNSEDNTRCNVFVSGCNINATFRGIDWENNDRALSMTATGNSIIVEPTIGAPKGSSCIYMSEMNAANNANYHIFDNLNLETRSAIAGIFTYNVQNAEIRDNYIYTKENSNPAPGTIGISLYGGGINQVNCNHVNNSIPQTNTGTRGLDVSLSSENEILCNEFKGGTFAAPTGSFIGMRFGGLCAATVMKGNAMINNNEGLHLNNVGAIGNAEIGGQDQGGNIWVNYQNTNGAVNDNFNSVLGSIFKVNTFSSGFSNDPNPQYHPANPNPGWFQYFPLASPYSCITYQTCGLPHEPTADDGSDDQLERDIATDSIQTPVYTAESKNIGEQYLFDKLTADSSMMADDTIYQQFYSEKLTEPVGRLNDVKRDLKNAEIYSTQSVYLLTLADSLIKLKNDSINLLDSLNIISPVTNYDNIRNNIIDGINILNNTYSSIKQQEEINAGIIRDTAAMKNSAIVPVEVPEINTKQINEIVILYKQNGKSEIASNYSQILAIATQCPYAGGPAVYQARAIVGMVNDTIEYFDDAICLQSGIYRAASSDQLKTLLPVISIIPNPANSEIEISVYSKFTGFCHINIVNLLGSEVISEQMPCETRNKKINISKLAAGIYVVKVQSNELTKNAKLVINR